MTASKNATRTVATVIACHYSTKAFTYDSATRTFTAEASSLGWRPGSFSRHIWLTSARTGERRLFSLRGSCPVSWWFESRDPLNRDRDPEGPLRILVFND